VIKVSWFVIGVLYALGLGIFRWLGGIGAACDAISEWGRRTAERKRRSLTTHSS
jgi:hypothetical protein